MITEVSTQLLELKKEISEIEDRQKEELNPKKEMLKTLQEKFIEALTAQGLKSIKTDEANFSLASRKGYRFTNEIEARKWAVENNAYSVDSRLAGQVLSKLDSLPEFVEQTETNYLTIKEVK